ncbi:MAG: cobalt transporter CbiM [Syntrophobacteraceae bacterium]
MHISDGVLPTSLAVGTYAAALAVAGWSARKTKGEDLPKIAVVTSAFFVASLIHVPIGPTSVHLLLPGLVGILLGPSGFISIALGLVLQSLLFQFGGITALGANSLMMGLPALASWGLFRLMKGDSLTRYIVSAAFAGGFGVLLAAAILALLLAISGEDFIGVAKLAIYAHLPVVVIEAAISAFSVSFLYKVKPELLGVALPAAS